MDYNTTPYVNHANAARQIAIDQGPMDYFDASISSALTNNPHLKDMVNPMVLEHMAKGPHGPHEARVDQRANMVDAAVNRGYVAGQKDARFPLYNNHVGEEKLYQEARIVLPPKELLSRLPKLEVYVKAEGKAGKGGLLDEIKEKWVPNATLFVCPTYYLVLSLNGSLTSFYF